MRVPDEVAAMLRLHGLGWGTRRIAAELGCDRETVQRYLAAGGWAPCRTPERPGVLAGQGAWLEERFRRHRGNADVVRQELEGELGVTVSLRTVERACAPLRRELASLHALRPGGQFAGQYGIAVGAMGEQLRLLQASARNLHAGDDPVAEMSQLQQQLTPLEARAQSSWQALGSSACVNQ